uniref:Uncharacterized protein n=1 Tax=Lactuca sativa TaxID=4236 RepID=A0A9R1W0K0_LACSA|nr:hypothetical protein LSAT_V11C300156140 [Lactuca sativa]
MSQFLLRDTLKRKQHTSVRFKNKRTNDEKSVGNISVPLSTPTLSTPALSSSSSRTTLSSVGTVSAPTFVSHVGTMGATSSTHASSIPTSSNQSFLPISSTQSFVPTSMQSSTPASTTSSIPTSTVNYSESVEENVGIQHREYLLGSTGLDGRLYIGVRDKELFPSGPCSSVIYESFGERAGLNGYSWATLSDETKLLYCDEFHCYWDDAKTLLVQACWKNKAKERYRQYIYNKSSKWKKLQDGILKSSRRNQNKKKKNRCKGDDFMERRDHLEAIGEEIDEDKLFYDVVGGHDRKKRLYGFGSYGKHIRSSKGSSEVHREQYEDNNAETKVEIEKKLVEKQREQYEDIQQKYEGVQEKYEDAQKKNVEFQQKNVDVQAKFEQQLAQAMNVINTLSEQVKTFIKQ